MIARIKKGYLREREDSHGRGRILKGKKG